MEVPHDKNNYLSYGLRICTGTKAALIWNEWPNYCWYQYEIIDIDTGYLMN